MKKTVLLTLSMTACVCLGVWSGCNKKDDGPSATFSMEQSVDVTIEGSYVLAPKLDDLAVGGVTFVSANPSVATVTEDGAVVGKSCGSTTITATFDEYTATATVTVGLGDNVPYIVIDNVNDGDEVKMTKNESFDFFARVMYGGKLYDDATVTYEVEETQVGSLEGSVFTAAQAGECTVTATASWRGVESLTLSQRINVEVQSSVVVAINNDSFTEYTLYMTDEHDGEEYETDLALDCVAQVDGQDVPYELTVESGANVLSIENDTVSAVSVGEAVVKLSATIEGEPFEKRLTVKVEKPLSKNVVNYTAAFDVNRGNLNVFNIFGKETTILEAYENGEAIAVKDGMLVDMYPNLGDANRTIEVYDQTAGYTVNLQIPTKESVVVPFHTELGAKYVEGALSKTRISTYKITDEHAYKGENYSLEVKTLSGESNYLYVDNCDITDLNAKDEKGNYLYNYIAFCIYTEDPNASSVSFNAATAIKLTQGAWTEVKATRSGDSFIFNGKDMFTLTKVQKELATPTEGSDATPETLHSATYLNNLAIRIINKKEKVDGKIINYSTTTYISAIRVGYEKPEEGVVAAFNTSNGRDYICHTHGTVTRSMSSTITYGAEKYSLKASYHGKAQPALFLNNLLITDLNAKDENDEYLYDYLYFYAYLGTDTKVKMHLNGTKNTMINLVYGEWVELKAVRDGDTFKYDGKDIFESLGTSSSCKDYGTSTMGNVDVLRIRFDCSGNKANVTNDVYISAIRVSKTDPSPKA